MLRNATFQIISALTCLCLAAEPAAAFDLPEHGQATDLLRGVQVTLNKKFPGEEYEEGFTERALDEIRQANYDTDSIPKGNAAFIHPERHFTNETFPESTQRLLDLKAEILMLVRAPRTASGRPNGSEARKKLGAALHLVQDFYSHSTWVEIGMRDINRAFGRSVLPRPGPEVRPCRADPNEIDDFTALSSGYYLGIEGCPDDPNIPVNGPSTPDPDGASELAPFLPPGKCFHGNHITCSGISKDLTPSAAAAKKEPFRQAHFKALELAGKATLDYIDQIVKALDGDDTALLNLFGFIMPLTYAIDDTGSMQPEIGGVKNEVRSLVSRILVNRQPEYYGLIRFNDPDIATGPITDDRTELLDAVNAIVPTAGGDEPEPVNAALLKAMEVSLNTSKIILYTNATVKDPELADEVAMRANEKDIAIVTKMLRPCIFLPTVNPDPRGGCFENPPVPLDSEAQLAASGVLPIDPVYLRLADATGGLVIQGSTGGDADALLLALTSSDQAVLAHARGRLAFGATTRVPLVVDSTVSTLQVSVSTGATDSFAKPSIVLRRPVGGESDEVRTTEVFGGNVFTVQRPTAGTWQVEIRGSGEYLVAARAVSPVRFGSFEFVEESKEVHGGFAEIQGEPVRGSSALGEAVLVGSIASAEFELIGESGLPLRTDSGEPTRWPLEQDHPEAMPGYYTGPAALPAVPFRVAVSGRLTAAAGSTYRRVFPKLYRARPVGIEVVGRELVEAQAGESVQFEYRVLNVGETADFTFSTLDDLGFVTNVAPRRVSIASGESATIRVSARVDPQAEKGSLETIWLLARQVGVSGLLNSATTRIEVTD